MIDLAYDSLSEVKPYDPDEPHYPSLTIDSDDVDIPDEGTMVIRFKKRSETESTVDGETECRCTVDLCEIESIDGKKVSQPYKKRDEAGDALDAIAVALKKVSK